MKFQSKSSVDDETPAINSKKKKKRKKKKKSTPDEKIESATESHNTSLEVRIMLFVNAN